MEAEHGPLQDHFPLQTNGFLDHVMCSWEGTLGIPD